MLHIVIYQSIYLAQFLENGIYGIKWDYGFYDSNELRSVSLLFNRDNLIENNTSYLTDLISKNDCMSAIISDITATTSDFCNKIEEKTHIIPETKLSSFLKKWKITNDKLKSLFNFNIKTFSPVLLMVGTLGVTASSYE